MTRPGEGGEPDLPRPQGSRGALDSPDPAPPVAPRPPRAARPVWSWVALAVALLAIGLVVSRPLPREWSHAVPLNLYPPLDGRILPRTAGDTLQLYYHLWLVRDGLLGRSPLLRDPYQFAGGVPPSNLYASFPPLALPFVVTGALGPIRGYNLLVLLSFPFTGLAAYALVRRHTGSPLAGAIAGAAYALMPVRLRPLFEGQPAGFSAGLVPLVLLGLDVALVDRRAGGALLAGLAYLALAMLEPHYAYITAWLALSYVALRWLGRPARCRAGLRLLLAFGAPAAAGVAWLWMLRETRLVGSVIEPGRSLEEIRGATVGPAALASWATYGGRLVAILAVVGLLGAWRHDRALRLFYAAVALVGIVLGLGPTLPGVPLYEALHRWLPLFGFIRNLPRFGIMTALGATVLAGYAISGLTAWGPGLVRPWVAIALWIAVVADTAPWHPIAAMRLDDNPVYAVLRAEARRVLYLPLWPGESVLSSAYLYHPTRTRVPMLNGYSALSSRQHENEVVRPLSGLNAGDLDGPASARLRELGVTHVVLDRALPNATPFPFAFTRARLAASRGLQLVVAADPLWLFRLTGAPRDGSPVPTSPVGVFFEAEALPRETGTVALEVGASSGRIVTARTGLDRPGLLLAGFEPLLPRGAYRGAVRMRGQGLQVEVAGEDEGAPTVSRAIPAATGWVDSEFVFSVDRARATRVQLRWDGQGHAAVDTISITFADRPQPEWRFDAADLTHEGEAQPDRWAGGRAVVRVTAEQPPGSVILRGPTRRFPAGQHRVEVYARADSQPAGPVLEITVTEPWGPVLAQRTGDARDLVATEYRPMVLSVWLGRPTVLDVVVRYLGGPGVSLDRVVLAPW